jgi:hypothetical protein
MYCFGKAGFTMLPFPQHRTAAVSNPNHYLEVMPNIQQSHHLGITKQLEQSYDETHLPPQGLKLPTPSPSNAKCNHVSQVRILLLLLAAVTTVVIITGIVFVAHQDYISFGGQGFLKAGSEDQFSAIRDLPELYLPIRAIETFNDQSGLTKRSPGNVPFYTCGDQQQSCELYGQPVGYCHSDISL